MAIGPEKNTGDSLSIIRLGYSICSSNWPIIHGEYVYVYIWKQLKLLNPNRSLHSLDTKTWLQAAQDHLEMSCAPSAMDKLCVKTIGFHWFSTIFCSLFSFCLQCSTSYKTMLQCSNHCQPPWPVTKRQASYNQPGVQANEICHQNPSSRCPAKVYPND